MWGGKNVLFLDNLKSKLVMPKKTGGLWLILFLLSFPVRAADYFKWPPVSSAFDSIASQVEYGFIHHAGREQRKTWIKMLDSLSACLKGEAGRVMQWRSLYWKARTLLIGGDRMASDSVLSEALVLVDSLHWPYDYMRMLHLKASLRKESLPDTYIALKGIEDFYRQARDSFMLAHACIDIGTVLTEIGDYGKAFGYMQEAGDIYRDLGETVYETKNRLNVANLLYLNGNYEISASMLKQLLEDSVCKEDVGFLIRVLLLLSEEGNDPDSMYAARAYGLARRYQASAFEKYAAVYLGDWYKDAGASDSALRMYCHAGEIDVRIPDALELLRLRHLAEVYGALGRDKEALRCWTRYAALKDTVDEEDNLLKIHQAEWRSVIARYEMDLLYSQERAAYKMKLSWMIWGGLVLFLLAPTPLPFCGFSGEALAETWEEAAIRLEETERQEKVNAASRDLFYAITQSDAGKAELAIALGADVNQCVAFADATRSRCVSRMLDYAVQMYKPESDKDGGQAALRTLRVLLRKGALLVDDEPEMQDYEEEETY